MHGMKLPDDIREFFRQQGKIGAAKRHAGMTAERRSAVAKLAAKTRWARADTKTTKKSAIPKTTGNIQKSKRSGGTK